MLLFPCWLKSVVLSNRLVAQRCKPVICVCTCRKQQTIRIKQFSSIYEPDGLDFEPEIPEYDELNLRLRGYDYVVLESCAKYVHNLVGQFQVDSTSWAVPARTKRIQTFKPNSSNIKDTYNLAMYERTIQVQNMPNTIGPILFEAIRQSLPEGVEFMVKEPDEEEQEFRYIPDVILQDLQSQMEEIDQAKEDRKKK